MKKDISFEEKMTRLEAIAEKMQTSDVTLNESVALYEEGMNLVSEMTAELEGVRKKIKLLSPDGSLTDFENGEESE